MATPLDGVLVHHTSTVCLAGEALFLTVVNGNLS